MFGLLTRSGTSSRAQDPVHERGGGVHDGDDLLIGHSGRSDDPDDPLQTPDAVLRGHQGEVGQLLLSVLPSDGDLQSALVIPSRSGPRTRTSLRSVSSMRPFSRSPEVNSGWVARRLVFPRRISPSSEIGPVEELRPRLDEDVQELFGRGRVLRLESPGDAPARVSRISFRVRPASRSFRRTARVARVSSGISPSKST